MSIPILDDISGEFPINNRPRLCLEIICTEKNESTRWNMTCLAGQMAENQNKDGSIHNPIANPIGQMLEKDDNDMVTSEKQTATFVIKRLRHLECLRRYIPSTVI